MKLRRFSKGLFAACLVAAVFPPSASAGPERDGSEDGQSKREAAAAFRAEAFRAADKDADGYLSAAEFAELPALMAALRRQRAFERLDADGDGQLIQEELASAAKRREAEAFRAADKDADGHLSAAEFAELPSVMAALRRQRAFERLDADGDGQLMQKELDSAKWRGARAFSGGARGGTPRMERAFSGGARGGTPRMERAFSLSGGAREGFLRTKDPVHSQGGPPGRR